MILSDSEILESTFDGSLIIKPFNNKNLGSNSYDVTLNKKLLIYSSKILDVKKKEPVNEIIIPEEGLILNPGELYLGVINEFVSSKNLLPCFEGKSSLARLGIFVHITAGFGDVGYEGYFTLEITCVKPIIIYPNMKIGQIYWHEVKGEVINPYNVKKDQKYNSEICYPQPSKMYLNFKDFRKSRFEDSGIVSDEENYI